jgi:prevent-host-death family protein
MTTATAYEAKTHFADLLRRAQRGESITITRHGVPVAKIGPPDETPRRDIDEVITAMKELRKGVTLKGLTIREMIEEGRM